MSDTRQSMNECDRLLDGLLARLAEAEAKVRALENERDTLRFWNGKQDEELRDMRAKVIAAHGEAQSRMEERDAAILKLQHIRHCVRHRQDFTARAVWGLVRDVDPDTKAEKPPRRWQNEPPADRSGKWWHAFKGIGDPRIELVPDSLRWDVAELKSACYNLWLPWEPNDTKENLPPLPDPDTNRDTVTRSEPADDTRGPAEPKAEECLRLVARLANAFVGFFEARECPNSVDVMESIAAAARKAGGA